MLSQSAWQIDITVEPPFQGELSEAWLESVVARAVAAALPDQPAGQVSLLVTGDATVQDLNRRFRGLDQVTDVLSFSNTHPGHWQGQADPPPGQYLTPGQADSFPFPWPDDEPPPLGEVVLSYPQAQRQAQEQGDSVIEEVAHLVIHGVLHLAGHDHLEPEETARMQALEAQALAGVVFTSTLPSSSRGRR